MPRNTPKRHDEPLRWLRANGHDLAGLTGQDVRALLAVAQCWELYAVADDRQRVLCAIADLVPMLQPKYAALCREVIPYAMDWSDRERLWPEVVALMERFDTRVRMEGS